MVFQNKQITLKEIIFNTYVRLDQFIQIKRRILIYKLLNSPSFLILSNSPLDHKNRQLQTKQMKAFDFPSVFNYVVGCLQLVKQHPNKKPEKQQIFTLPQQIVINGCKEYLYGKRRLIEVEHQSVKTQRFKTQRSETKSKKQNTFCSIKLRKLESHRTHATNFPTKFKQVPETKSLKSYRSKKTFLPVQRLQKLTVDSQESDFQTKQIKQTTKNLNDKKNGATKKKIHFKNESSENGDKSQFISMFPSKKSMLKNQSRTLTSSRRLLERHKTQVENQNEEVAFQPPRSIKKVANFLLRKQWSTKNKKTYYQEQKENLNQNQPETSKKISQHFKKKATFVMTQGSQLHTDNLRKGKSNSKKTNLSKKVNRANNQPQQPNQNLVSFKSNGSKNSKNQQYQSACSINIRQSRVKNLQRKVSLKLQEIQKLRTTSEKDFINEQKQRIKRYLQKKYKVKTQKWIRFNVDKSDWEQSPNDQNATNPNNSYPNNVDRHTGRRTQKLDTLLFKKKRHFESTTNHSPNGKVAKRIKKSVQDQTCIQIPSEEYLSSSGQLPSRGNHTRNILPKKKIDIFNVYTDLNEFHKIMNQHDIFEDNDKNAGEINTKNLASFNPFTLLTQQVDKRDYKPFQQRKIMFDYDDSMLKVTKKFINKANQLKQISVY